MTLFSHEHEDPEPQYLVNMDGYTARHTVKTRPADAEIAALLRELSTFCMEISQSLVTADDLNRADVMEYEARAMAEKLEQS